MCDLPILYLLARSLSNSWPCSKAALKWHCGSACFHLPGPQTWPTYFSTKCRKKKGGKLGRGMSRLSLTLFRSRLISWILRSSESARRAHMMSLDAVCLSFAADDPPKFAIGPGQPQKSKKQQEQSKHVAQHTHISSLPGTMSHAAKPRPTGGEPSKTSSGLIASSRRCARAWIFWAFSLRVAVPFRRACPKREARCTN